MIVFVTGASGFVGGAATKALVARGHKVLAMSRSERSDALIRALGGTPVRCDLEDIKPADIGGANVVLHCAAFVAQWGPSEAWKRFNVEGTARVLAAARKGGAARFIHISTESVLWRGQHLRNVDETYPLAPDSPYPYAATKAQAEMLVQASSDSDFQTIILRPRFIWGPGDTTWLPTIEAVAAAGKWLWVEEGRARTSTTHIDNLVHAIQLALTKGGDGAAYFILDDGVRTMKEMISGIAAARAIRLPEKSIPAWLSNAVGATCEILWRALPLKGEPPLTRFSAMILSRDCILSDAKARAELGYRPVIDVEDGLRGLRARANQPPGVGVTRFD
jgi:nucleoside-diphosphate-sugar epimerase